MKLTIETTSIDEYNIWSKMNSHAIEVILVNEKQRTTKELLKQHLFNSIPYNYKDYSGIGYYLIKDLGYYTDIKTGADLFFARALYKTQAGSPFRNDAEVLLYLNPLYAFNSNGRKDFEIGALRGATIEIIKPFVNYIYHQKKSYSSFNYRWRIIDFPDEQDDTYLEPMEILQGYDLSEDELAALGY